MLAKSLMLQSILIYFSKFGGRRLGEGGVFLLIANLCDAVVCTDRFAGCVFKVCRD